MERLWRGRWVLAAALFVGACGTASDDAPTTAQMSQAIVDQCLSPNEDPTTVEFVDSVQMFQEEPDLDITSFAFRYVTDRGDGTLVWTRAEYVTGMTATGSVQCGADALVRCDPDEIAEREIPRHEHCEWYWQPVSEAQR